MSQSYPVTFDIQRPAAIEKSQVFIRVAIFVVVALLSSVVNWVLGLFFLAIPIYAAVNVSSKGSEGWLREGAPTVVRVLRYYLAVLAYLTLATNRLPTEDPERTLDLKVEPGGTHTVGSALLRYLTVIPHGFVLGILGFISFVLVLASIGFVLARGAYPEGIFTYQRGYLRWNARVLAYFASLVGEYPPFSFE